MHVHKYDILRCIFNKVNSLLNKSNDFLSIIIAVKRYPFSLFLFQLFLFFSSKFKIHSIYWIANELLLLLLLLFFLRCKFVIHIFCGWFNTFFMFLIHSLEHLNLHLNHYSFADYLNHYSFQVILFVLDSFYGFVYNHKKHIIFSHMISEHLFSCNNDF